MYLFYWTVIARLQVFSSSNQYSFILTKPNAILVHQFVLEVDIPCLTYKCHLSTDYTGNAIIKTKL